MAVWQARSQAHDMHFTRPHVPHNCGQPTPIRQTWLLPACLPACPSLPCSAMNGAQSAAFGTYAALTWLGRKAEMASASWLKNALEDTSSGEWVGRGGLLAGGVVGDAAGSAADGRSVRQWRVAARVGRGRLGPSSSAACVSCCCCRLVPPARLCRRRGGPPAPRHPALLCPGGAPSLFWVCLCTSMSTPRLCSAHAAFD